MPQSHPYCVFCSIRTSSYLTLLFLISAVPLPSPVCLYLNLSSTFSSALPVCARVQQGSVQGLKDFLRLY